MHTRPIGAAWLLAAMLGAALAGRAQTSRETVSSRIPARNLIVPQSRAFSSSTRPSPIRVESMQARVRIVAQTATTALEFALHNPSPRREEAVLLVPIPEHAAVSSFRFEGQGDEPSFQVLHRDEARRLYDAIVAEMRDPALLEFAGHNLLRSSVFPLAAGARLRVRLSYEHLLAADGERVEYRLLRSQSLEPRAPWRITIDLRADAEIATVYSPSHAIVAKRRSPRRFTVRLAEGAGREPGSFLLAYLVERGEGVTASLFAYPDPKAGGGYFLLLAGVPAVAAEERGRVRREVTLVLDRSGSMAGAKLEQARAAALQVIEGLDPCERFNVIDYATTVARLAPAPLEKRPATVKRARAYLEGLRPGGGTNLHDALVEALRQPHAQGSLPIVLFLTDGLPTVGTTSEIAIREAVERGNAHARRVFALGVGHDVNAPLLDRIAEVSRGTSGYVQPGEDVEVQVPAMFRKLYGPVLAAPELVTVDAGDEVDTTRVRDLQPARIPDLFENDRLVLLGRYRGEEPVRFRLSGDWFGRARTFAFRLDPRRATTRNAFVPRLWASRQIADLIDRVRQAGARWADARGGRPADAFADPRMRELRDEILRLSTQFGILSEYTAFLATEGTRLSDWHEIVATCGAELRSKAVHTRSGTGAVNQAANIRHGKGQSWLNPRNAYLDSKLQRVTVSGVRQVHDRAFFRRGKRWVDGRIVLGGDFTEHDQVRYGTAKHRALLWRLIREGRQGVLGLDGEILLRVDGKNVLVVNDC